MILKKCFLVFLIDGLPRSNKKWHQQPVSYSEKVEGSDFAQSFDDGSRLKISFGVKPPSSCHPVN